MPRHKSISDEEVLDRALPVLAREGPTGFTLASLARETGLAPATLLQRFGSKQTIIERAFQQDNLRFARWINDLPEGKGFDATLAIYRDMVEGFHEEPGLEDHLLWLREDIRDPLFNALTRKRFALFREAILKRLPPVVLPRNDVAALMDAQCHGAIIQWAIEPKGRLADYVMGSLASVLKLAAKQR